MLAKAIATGFNSPIVTIPASGFASSFIGMDGIIVRIVARPRPQLAAKWAVSHRLHRRGRAIGCRREALGAAAAAGASPRCTTSCFYGTNGALTPNGELVLETERWRERVFAARADHRPQPALQRAIRHIRMPNMFGGGGGVALNQLLITMDGVENPPLIRRSLTKWTNLLLDASYVVPQRLHRPRAPCACRARSRGASRSTSSARPTSPLSALDPALTRPAVWAGRSTCARRTRTTGRHHRAVYLDKVAHRARARRAGGSRRDRPITDGYSRR